MVAACVLVGACAHAPQRMPEVVKVPIPVDCEIAQVPVSEMPVPPADANVFTLTANALARIKLLLAENVQLRAANNNPCPAVRP